MDDAAWAEGGQAAEPVLAVLELPEVEVVDEPEPDDSEPPDEDDSDEELSALAGSLEVEEPLRLSVR